MSKRIKLTYGTENRMLNPPQKYEEFVAKIEEVFKIKFIGFYKAYYKDPDGDLITVTNQEDYALALSQQQQGQLRMFIGENADTVNQSLMLMSKTEVKKQPVIPSLKDAEIVQSHYEESTSISKKEQKEILEKPEIKKVIEQKEEKPKAKEPMVDIRVPEPPVKPIDKAEQVQIVKPKEIPQVEKEEESKKFVLQNDPYACLACDGTKVTKKNKPCKHCKGTGKVPETFLNRVRQTIKGELASVYEEEVAVAASEIIESQRMIPKSKCSRCGVQPIQGQSYNCSKCPEGVFCTNCKPFHDSEHAAKVEVPVMKPVEKVAASVMPSTSSIYKIEAPDKRKSAPQVHKDGEDLKDEYHAKKGEEITKTWTFTNIGSDAWPSDTAFKMVSGDHPLEMTIGLVGAVPSGQTIKVPVKVKAPMEAGRYVAYFKLCYGSSSSFGERPWIDFFVDEN